MTKYRKLKPVGENHGKFHWLFLGEQTSTRNRYDNAIFETKNFVVMPSLGSLVAGWLLVVPKTPLGRIVDLNRELRQEFEVLVNQSIDKVEREFGRAFLFEHGGKNRSKISCGVDQAHLHIVPLEFNLLRLAEQTTQEPRVIKDEFVLPYDICGLNEYWYVSDKKRTLAITATEPKSQWFRKLIAHEIGQGQKWDYREHPFHSQIDRTLRVMGADGRR